MDFSPKTSIWILSLGLLLMGPSAMATEIFYAPGTCAPEQLMLKVKNRTNNPERLWTQVRLPDQIDEIQFDIDGNTEIKIAGKDFLPSQMAYSIKTWENNRIQVTASCAGTETLLTTTTSPTVSHFIPANVRTVKIDLLNLFLNSNQIQLQAISRTGTLLEEKTLKIENYYDTASVKWNLPSSVYQIDIKASARMHSVLNYESNGKEQNSPAVALSPTRLAPDTAKTYFLVSTKEAHPDEAFVVAMDDPAKISTARDQIRNPNLEKILVAGIELGDGGTNRAFLSRDKAPYSWNVTRVDAFADFAHIDCDGSPDLTEERLMQKINEGGRICFWRYRIVRELTLEEVASGKLKP
jgi:hypothetical protein